VVAGSVVDGQRSGCLPAGTGNSMELGLAGLEVLE